VGVDRFDPQLPRRPRELRFGLGIGILGVDAEDAVFVAVKRDRHAVRHDVVVQYAHIAQRGLGRDEAQLGERAAGCAKTARRASVWRRPLYGGIADEYQQGAGRTASFKPVVRAAVDLEQLAETGAAAAHRVDAGLAAVFGLPETRRDHLLAHGFHREPDGVLLAQLLCCQRRAKVGVVCTDQRHRLRENGRLDAVVGDAPALFADEPRQTKSAIAFVQTMHLPHRDADALGRLCLADFARCHLFQYLRSFCLFQTHQFVHSSLFAQLNNQGVTLVITGHLCFGQTGHYCFALTTLGCGCPCVRRDHYAGCIGLGSGYSLAAAQAVG